MARPQIRSPRPRASAAATPGQRLGTWFVAAQTERGPLLPDPTAPLYSIQDYVALYGTRASLGSVQATYDQLDAYWRTGGGPVLLSRVVGPAAAVASLNLRTAPAPRCDAEGVRARPGRLVQHERHVSGRQRHRVHVRHHDQRRRGRGRGVTGPDLPDGRRGVVAVLQVRADHRPGVGDRRAEQQPGRPRRRRPSRPARTTSPPSRTPLDGGAGRAARRVGPRPRLQARHHHRRRARRDDRSRRRPEPVRDPVRRVRVHAGHPDHSRLDGAGRRHGTRVRGGVRAVGDDPAVRGRRRQPAPSPPPGSSPASSPGRSRTVPRTSPPPEPTAGRRSSPTCRPGSPTPSGTPSPAPRTSTSSASPTARR
jgi:hypothetical protein